MTSVRSIGRWLIMLGMVWVLSACAGGGPRDERDYFPG